MTGEASLLTYAIATGVIMLFLGSWLIDARRSRRTEQECPVAGTLRADLQQVSEKVDAIETDVERMRERLRSTASHRDVEDIKRMTQENRAAIDKISSSLPDIEARQRALHDTVGELRTDMAVTRTSAENVEKQVGRMMSVIVTKGMEK